MRLGKTGVVRRGWSGCTRLLDSLPDLFGTTARPARAYVLGRSAVAASLRTEARAQSHPWLCSEDISPRTPVLVIDSLASLRGDKPRKRQCLRAAQPPKARREPKATIGSQ